jgi:hypothetical protein
VDNEASQAGGFVPFSNKKVFMTAPFRVIVSILLASVVSITLLAQSGNQEVLEWHVIRTDQQGKILPWFSSNLGASYDRNIRLVWEFWKDMRDCPNGVKYYLQHRFWKKRETNQGLGGDQVAMAMSSWNLLHQYLGDAAVKENMVFLADYYLTHSLSPPTDAWPNVPYPYNTEVHSGVYDGDLKAGKQFFQPDKAASFAAELIVLYKITGSLKYLDAAIKIADSLTDKIKVGDAENSPWPYRVHTRKDKVHTVVVNGVVHRASYTANWAGALRLFDELIALGEGRIADYQRARGILVDWIKAYPLKTNRWGPFFEDIGTEVFSDTETNADTMATYILEHPEWDPDWRRQAEGILNWSLSTFGNRNWIDYGVVPINEQTAFMVPGNSHSSRHASVELIFGEKTGDHSRTTDAIRRLNWATYMVNHDGKNRYPEGNIWLTDGYGDYVRHYLRAMAALPSLGPEDQNHLLRTSSVVKSISYEDDTISYEKFDQDSQERFKMGAWVPGSIQGGQMHWDATTRVLTVTSTHQFVSISKHNAGASAR